MVDDDVESLGLLRVEVDTFIAAAEYNYWVY